MKRLKGGGAKNTLESSLLDLEERAGLLDFNEVDQDGGLSNLCGGRLTCLLCCDVGSASIVVTIAVLLTGIILLIVAKSQPLPFWVDQLSRYIISAGVFGVASGGTNAIALFMLLYKIPFVHGSGVFYRQHQQIRNVIKMIVLQLLFSSEHLQNYISKKIRQFSSHVMVTDNITTALNSPEAMDIIQHHLDLAFAEPEAQFLETFGYKRSKIEAMIRPAVLSLCAEAAPYVLDNMNQSQLHGPKAISVPRFRKEMDQYLSWRIEELTAQHIGQLMKELMQQHLGWVVVWGCIIGGLSGILTQAIRISLNFNFIL